MRIGFLSLSRELRDEIYYHIFRQPQEDDFDYWDQPFHAIPQPVLDWSLSHEEALERARNLHLESRRNHHDRELCTHKAFLLTCRQIYDEVWAIFVRNHRLVFTTVHDVTACFQSPLPRARLDVIQHIALIDLCDYAQKTPSQALADLEIYGETVERLWTDHKDWFNNLLSLTIDLRLPEPGDEIFAETYIAPILQPLINRTAATHNHDTPTRQSKYELNLRFSHDSLQLNYNPHINYIRMTAEYIREPIRPSQLPNQIEASKYRTYSSHTDIEYGRTTGILGTSAALASWPVGIGQDDYWRLWSQNLSNLDMLMYPTDSRDEQFAPGGAVQYDFEQATDWNGLVDRRVPGRTVWFRSVPPDRILRSAPEKKKAKVRFLWQKLELPDGIQCRIPEDGFACMDSANPGLRMWQGPYLQFGAGPVKSEICSSGDDV